MLRSRFIPLLLIGSASLLLSGCVYLRLLELKKQLSHFDVNFVVLASEDLTLECLHPLLQAEDLRWLGAIPQTTTLSDKGEDWVIRWVKEPPSAVKEANIYDMEIDVHFVDGSVVEVCVPKRFLAYVSKELLVSMLRSTGTAKVDRNNRNADAQTESPPAASLPNLTSISAMLGEPTDKQNTSGRVVYFYRDRLDIPNPSTKPLEASFAFDPVSGELKKFTARLPRGTLNYDFTGPSAAQAPDTVPGSTTPSARSGP
jgi:hypothetical protein